MPRTLPGIAAGAVVLSLLLAMPTSAAETSATALYRDRVVAIERSLADPSDLWVLPEDMTAVNDFVLKPEGACLDDICVPVSAKRDSDLVVQREGETWISLTALARRLDQPVVAEPSHRVFSFGPIPATRNAFLEGAMAPDFALPDRSGRLVRLSDFRGKKVLLLSWASW